MLLLTESMLINETMTLAKPCIKIKAKANHHALFLMISACILLACTLVINQYYGQDYRISFIFLYLLTFVLFLVGLYKHSEPKFSYYIQHCGVQYHHRHGSWRISWHHIKKIRCVTETLGTAEIYVPYIGIKLKNIDTLAERISPRLANNLIHEQKLLLSYALANQLLSFEQTQLNFSPFVLESGNTITGPIAAFMFQSQLLQTALGYHLYIPEQSTDRSLVDFCQLLNQCKNYALDNNLEKNRTNFLSKQESNFGTIK